MTTTIFTDGSSRGNPGPGGWGAVIATANNVVELGGRDAHTTNNRMEMMAVCDALSHLKTFHAAHNIVSEEGITLYSDSAYVINGIQKWVKGWKRNGWITSTKQEVLNRDLWQKLDELASPFDIQWIRLKGHAGLPGNERCDVIATEFADGLQPTLYNGDRKNYSIDLNQVTQSAGSNSSSSKSKSSSKGAKAFSYVSSVKGNIFIDATWAECEKRVKGVSGTKFKKVFSKAEEDALVGEWSKK